MTTEQKIIRAKVGLLELAKQLGNVSQGVAIFCNVDRWRATRARAIHGCQARRVESPSGITEIGYVERVHTSDYAGDELLSSRARRALGGDTIILSSL